MGDNRCPMIIPGHLNCFEGLGQCAYLIELDEDGVGYTEINTSFDALRVGNKEIIPDKLNFAAKGIRELFPTAPVLFAHTVFKGNNRIAIGKIHPEIDHLIYGFEKTRLPEEVITGSSCFGSFVIHFCSRSINSYEEIFARHL